MPKSAKEKELEERIKVLKEENGKLYKEKVAAEKLAEDYENAASEFKKSRDEWVRRVEMIDSNLKAFHLTLKILQGIIVPMVRTVPHEVGDYVEEKRLDNEINRMLESLMNHVESIRPPLHERVIRV